MLTSLNFDRHVACEQIALAEHDVPILIDFDETLFLRNSTEEYLSSIKPRILALFVLRILEYLRPWHMIFGQDKGSQLRDWMRVICMSILFPWSFLTWPIYARRLSQSYENIALSNSISQSASREIIVATNGFNFIIRPILRNMSISYHRLIGCRGWMGFRDRQSGKKRLLESCLSQDALKESILVTDSRDDQELLDFVRYPNLVKWNDQNFQSSIPDGYFPFFYLEKVKKANQNFFVRSILIDEFVPFFLIFALPQPQVLLFSIGLFLLHLSFWLIYEMGYMENDQVAEKYEKNPTLSKYYIWGKDRIDFVRPWFWSFAFAFAGLLMWNGLNLGLRTWQDAASSELWNSLALDLSLWGLFLMLTRAVYYLYNYIDEELRIWVYPVLQALKFAGFFLLVPVTPLAIAYLLALVNSRWIPYIVYRCGNLKSYPDFPTQFAQFFGFLVMTGLFCLSGSGDSFLSLQAVMLLLLSLGLASKQILGLLHSVGFLKT